MTARSLIAAWNHFFFAKQSPTPIALFRIAYGASVIGTLLLLRPDWLTWFGTHAWISLSTMQTVEPGQMLSLFTMIPQTDACTSALFWIFLSSAVLLTAGFLTRMNTVIVYLCLISTQQRNLFITHGGDTFLRVAGFFLIFAPAGAALSVDRLIRLWRGREDTRLMPRSPWAQRMIQIQLSLVYFTAFCWKLKGPVWLQGTALYYVYHVESLRRFPLPAWFYRPAVLRLGSWSVLALEFSLGVLIWVKDLRYILLALGLLFHLWLEYSLNIPMFQWDILSAYILFVDPADITRAGQWARRRASGRLVKAVSVQP